MTAATHTATAPTAVAAPHSTAAAFSRFGGAVWATLVQLGHHRARHEMTSLAAMYAESRPELAAQLRAAAESPWQ